MKKNMHQIIRTLTSIFNTCVLVIGASVAYYEFVIKSDTRDMMRSEETYNKIQEISKMGSFMMEYDFQKEKIDFKKEFFSPEEKGDFIKSLDKALENYGAIRICLSIGKCDPKMVNKFLCPAILWDAQVINRTVVAEIEKGGLFVDRIRIWQFYELVENCISDRGTKSFGHEEFLNRFQHQIKLLKKIDQAIYNKLKK